MNCAYWEERLSDYLENTLSLAERDVVGQHLESCVACSELLAGVKGVVEWGRSFPVVDAPAWLPGRILANTPVIARESWFDTLASVGRWIIEPRTAMAIFTATLVFGWLGNLAGISPNWGAVVRDPGAVYYQAVRAAYRSPLVTQIQSQIEQLMEIS